MSMHEIEHVVENSIRVLDAHRPPDDDTVRDLIAALYRFQSWFDCSFTQFEVMEQLIRRRYTYRFPLDRHPDYAQRREYFDSLREFTALREFDEDDDDYDFEADQDWLEDGYVEPPYLFCDADTDLWRRMVDLDLLTGPDAAPLRAVPTIEAVVAAAAAAEAGGDRETIAMWYNLGPSLLIDDGPPTLDELRSMDAVRELREIVRRTDAISVKLPYDHRPTDEEIAADPVDAWWWHQLGSR